MTKRRHEFTVEETAELLDELDARLRQAGVAASIFIVGGAAIAANRTLRERVTEDIDALTRDTGSSRRRRRWRTSAACRRTGSTRTPACGCHRCPAGSWTARPEPGLRVTYADDGFLLATELIAQRAKDADDVVALAGRLGLEAATPEQLETHIRSYYTDPATLEFIVAGSDVDREISLLAHDASRMLRRTTVETGDVDATQADPGAERLQRSTDLERRTPPTLGGDPGPRPGTDR